MQGNRKFKPMLKGWNNQPDGNTKMIQALGWSDKEFKAAITTLLSEVKKNTSEMNEKIGNLSRKGIERGY